MDTREMARGLMNTRWPNFTLLLSKTPFNSAGSGIYDHLNRTIEYGQFVAIYSLYPPSWEIKPVDKWHHCDISIRNSTIKTIPSWNSFP